MRILMNISTDGGKTWQQIKTAIVKVPVRTNELYFCFEGDRLVTHAVTPDSSQGTDIQLYEELGDNLVDV
jgi:Neuraminidase (sialidase)